MLQLSSHSFQDGDTIPSEFAFAIPNATSHIALSSNHNPHLAWHGAPEGTQSFVLAHRHSPVLRHSCVRLSVKNRNDTGPHSLRVACWR
ncbi:hypothetical protein [Pectobacterium brasiliense]|uniref:hypothetical protein n=1 Tax=Pectobacterium brasiliense TaxID=180957 RepID=UPI001F07B888|nr:hypothetical protein [Pectobacterium brasiliense]